MIPDIREALSYVLNELENGRDNAAAAFTATTGQTFDQRGAHAHDVLRQTVGNVIERVRGILADLPRRSGFSTAELDAEMEREAQ